MQRGRAGRDREHVLRLEVLAHPPLELGGARPGRQPARAERLGDRLDLVLADRRAAGTRGSVRTRRSAIGSECFRHRRVTTSVCAPPRQSRRAPRPARASRRRRAPRPPGRRRGAAAANDVARARGRCAPARRPRAPSGTSTDSSTPGGGDEEARHGAADQLGRARAPPSIRSPSAASIASPFRSTPIAALDQLGVVPAAEPRRHLDHPRARPAPTRSCVYDGPSLDAERAPRARSATSAAASPLARGSARRGRARRRTRAVRRRRGR